MKDEHGPDRLCRRDACADGPQHRGGEHLDPRSPLYDGPDHSVSALNSGPRAAARALLAAGAPVPEVADLVNEIHRLGRTVAAVRVDMDQQVRAASERALDCTEHGKIIMAAEESVHHFYEQAESNDRARIAIVSTLHELIDAIAALKVTAKTGGELPTAEKLIEVISRYLKLAGERHGRAWHKPETKARRKKAEVPS